MADPLDTTFQSVYDEQNNITGTQITSEQQAGGMIDNYVKAYTNDKQNIAADQAIIDANSGSHQDQAVEAVAKAKKEMAGSEAALSAANEDASRVQTALNNFNANQKAGVAAPPPPSLNPGISAFNKSEDAPTASQSTPTDLGSGASVPSGSSSTPAPVSASVAGASVQPTPSTPTDYGSGGTVPASNPTTPATGGVAVDSPPPTGGVSGAADGQVLNGVEALTTYNVKAGDSMSSIAEKYGVSLQSLEAANKQVTDPHMIMAGSTIHVPTSTSASVVDGSASAAAAPNTLVELNAKNASFLQKVKGMLPSFKATAGGNDTASNPPKDPTSGIQAADKTHTSGRWHQ